MLSAVLSPLSPLTGDRRPGLFHEETSMDRRNFLAAAAGFGLVACSSDNDSPVTSAEVEGSQTTTSGPTTSGPTGSAATLAEAPDTGFASNPFTLGVASGDPASESIVLWTRLAPDPLVPDGAMAELADEDLMVAWDLASDAAMNEVLASGLAAAPARFAHSVHVEVEGLEPASEYFYRFRVGSETSPVGRTRTTSAAAETPDQVRFVIASCQDHQWGYFGAWKRASETEALDAVVFLGDYIYEYNLGDFSPEKEGAREWGVPVPEDLPTYRTRYGKTKQDTSLQAAHAAAPWIVTWDDHEVVNNYSGDEDPARGDASVNRARRAAAHQAWYEHMPVRLAPAEDWAEWPIHRRIEFGSLAALHVIETRDFADIPPCRSPEEVTASDEAALCEAALAPERTNLGAEQEAWLMESLGSTGAVWDVLANPIIISGIDVAEADAAEPLYILDTWDGYPASRSRVVERLGSDDVPNPVVVTGDFHKSFVLDLNDREGGPTVAPEFMVTSISTIAGLGEYLDRNPHIRYQGDGKGYAVCTLTPDEFRTDFHYLADEWDPDSPIERTDSFTVAAGSHEAVQV